ncbi:MAG: hypothetical protein LKJ73_07305 [Oscillospiraceae bacterium]|jgi:hypothetical protein|nr:hypothetical protein [Oscillospiraceae bacterium]
MQSVPILDNGQQKENAADRNRKIQYGRHKASARQGVFPRASEVRAGGLDKPALSHMAPKSGKISPQQGKFAFYFLQPHADYKRIAPAQQRGKRHEKVPQSSADTPENSDGLDADKVQKTAHAIKKGFQSPFPHVSFFSGRFFSMRGLHKNMPFPFITDL